MAGGGGLFGGNCDYCCAGGGSGYIGNGILFNKHMLGYNVETSNDINTKTNTTNSSTDVSSTAVSDKVKTGSGYAKISLIE